MVEYYAIAFLDWHARSMLLYEVCKERHGVILGNIPVPINADVVHVPWRYAGHPLLYPPLLCFWRLVTLSRIRD